MTPVTVNSDQLATNLVEATRHSACKYQTVFNALNALVRSDSGLNIGTAITNATKGLSSEECERVRERINDTVGWLRNQVNNPPKVLAEKNTALVASINSAKTLAVRTFDLLGSHAGDFNSKIKLTTQNFDIDANGNALRVNASSETVISACEFILNIFDINKDSSFGRTVIVGSKHPGVPDLFENTKALLSHIKGQKIGGATEQQVASALYFFTTALSTMDRTEKVTQIRVDGNQFSEKNIELARRIITCWGESALRQDGKWRFIPGRPDYAKQLNIAVIETKEALEKNKSGAATDAHAKIQEKLPSITNSLETIIGQKKQKAAAEQLIQRFATVTEEIELAPDKGTYLLGQKDLDMLYYAGDAKFKQTIIEAGIEALKSNSTIGDRLLGKKTKIANFLVKLLFHDAFQISNDGRFVDNRPEHELAFGARAIAVAKELTGILKPQHLRTIFAAINHINNTPRFKATISDAIDGKGRVSRMESKRIAESAVPEGLDSPVGQSLAELRTRWQIANEGEAEEVQSVRR